MLETGKKKDAETPQNLGEQKGMSMTARQLLITHFAFDKMTAREQTFIRIIEEKLNVNPRTFNYKAIVKKFLTTTDMEPEMEGEKVIRQVQDLIGQGVDVAKIEDEILTKVIIPPQQAQPISVHEITPDMIVSPKLDGVSYELRVGETRSYCVSRVGEVREVEVLGDYKDSIFLLESRAATLTVLDVFRLRGQDMGALQMLDRTMMIPKIISIKNAEPRNQPEAKEYKGKKPNAYARKKKGCKDLLSKKNKNTFWVQAVAQDFVPLSRITPKKLDEWQYSKIDGLCFYKPADPYGIVRTWKPYTLLSIDFRIGEVFTQQNLKIAELQLRAGDRMVTAQRVLTHDFLKTGAIWECTNQGHWSLDRERKDKKNPNDERSLSTFMRLFRLKETYQEMRQILYSYGGIANFAYMVGRVMPNESLQGGQVQENPLFGQLSTQSKNRQTGNVVLYSVGNQVEQISAFKRLQAPSKERVEKLEKVREETDALKEKEKKEGYLSLEKVGKKRKVK